MGTYILVHRQEAHTERLGLAWALEINLKAYYQRHTSSNKAVASSFPYSFTNWDPNAQIYEFCESFSFKSS